MTSSYTDTGLEKQGTGENSGTWGAKANTVFDMLNAMINGVVGVSFASDANKTITATDGSLADAHNRILLVTSGVSLTATRTLTIAPNDMEKLYYVQNNTTGSQKITVSQGSGAGVTIDNGRGAWVYCDGAGATAAVVSLNKLIQLERPRLAAYDERIQDLGTINTNQNLDLSLYNVFKCTLSGNVQLTFTNPPPSGFMGSATIIATQDATGSRTLTLAGGTVKQSGSTSGAMGITSTASKKSVVTAWTDDGGTTYYASLAMLNL